MPHWNATNCIAACDKYSLFIANESTGKRILNEFDAVFMSIWNKTSTRKHHSSIKCFFLLLHVFVRANGKSVGLFLLENWLTMKCMENEINGQSKNGNVRPIRVYFMWASEASVCVHLLQSVPFLPRIQFVPHLVLIKWKPCQSIAKFDRIILREASASIYLHRYIFTITCTIFLSVPIPGLCLYYKFAYSMLNTELISTWHIPVDICSIQIHAVYFGCVFDFQPCFRHSFFFWLSNIVGEPQTLCQNCNVVWGNEIKKRHRQLWCTITCKRIR